jgi:PhnB protein
VPYLAVHNAPRAIKFYKTAFGASETLRFEDDNGRIGHCTLNIGNSLLFLSDEFPGICSSPKTLSGTSVLLHFYTENVDEVAQRAVAAGAKVIIPVNDQFYGDRSGRFEDPYGHIWTIATHKEDASPEELRRRAEAWAAKQPEHSET